MRIRKRTLNLTLDGSYMKLDNLLERDRIYAAAKIIRSVEAIRRKTYSLWHTLCHLTNIIQLK